MSKQFIINIPIADPVIESSKYNLWANNLHMCIGDARKKILQLKFIFIRKKRPVHACLLTYILACIFFQSKNLNFTIACAKTFDYPVPAMTLIYHLNTDRSCSISLTSDKHEAKIAAGHPKSKFYRCNHLFISEMKNNRKRNNFV